MYSNLIVEQAGVELAAWEVEIFTDGHALVKLDAQDGAGSYCEPAGLRRLEPKDGPITISASF